MATCTLDDLVREFERLAAMPDDTFFTDGYKIYFNCIVSPDGDDHETTPEESAKYENLVDTVLNGADGMACELLIKTDGGCNWDNIEQLRSRGYKVYPTDKDSFGWLCAAIEKDNHVLSYG